MEKLPLTYSRGNPSTGMFFHEQLARTESKAIYKVFARNKDGHIIGYEIFFVKVQKECDVVMGGVNVHMAEKEMLPSNNSFGFWAFSYGNVGDKKAMEIFHDLKVPEVDLDQPRRRGRPRKVILAG